MSDSKVALDLDPIDRWSIFARLQDLSVPCECVSGQPLQVSAASPTAVLHIWTVVRRTQLSRAAAIATLETCWNMTVTA
ncbi:MAG: hypothetical protein F6K00_09215 [Leptolyngbya sp. SIOISBB]|nr:hypothetical protein [Leptolyngbya sp. SIOISBB]